MEGGEGGELLVLSWLLFIREGLVWCGELTGEGEVKGGGDG